MKKALALVLALVLALSMAVSAFAATLVVLGDVSVNANNDVNVYLTSVDATETEILYTTTKGVYYIALDDKPYTDIKVTANGNLAAELVEYDPATMNVWGMEIVFDITYAGEALGDGQWFTADGVNVESTDKYAQAVAYAKDLNDEHRVNLFGVAVRTNVNIIKVTVADNYGVAYEEGTLKIEAKLDKVPYATSLRLINDVTIFEYEQVKWAAANYADGKALVCGDLGYSDFFTAKHGYDFADDDYDWYELRTKEDAAVISTTAFRAIEGQNIAVSCGKALVEIFNVAKGQKGVNFKHDYYTVDANRDGKIESINLDFYGNQVIAGDYAVTLVPGYDWFTLREAFGVKVEEDDIITYYVLKNGKVVKEYTVDYMVADIYAPVVVEIAGSNSALGCYEIVLEVPAVEGGEENPNTGAEAVVGVVAALAVVSVATADAVSLKK